MVALILASGCSKESPDAVPKGIPVDALAVLPTPSYENVCALSGRREGVVDGVCRAIASVNFEAFTGNNPQALWPDGPPSCLEDKENEQAMEAARFYGPGIELRVESGRGYFSERVFGQIVTVIQTSVTNLPHPCAMPLVFILQQKKVSRVSIAHFPIYK